MANQSQSAYPPGAKRNVLLAFPLLRRLQTSGPRPSVGSQISFKLTALKSIAFKAASWLARVPELSIRQQMNPNKTHYWQAYDPRTSQSFRSNSEAEMRFWIEQHDRGSSFH